MSVENGYSSNRYMIAAYISTTIGSVHSICIHAYSSPRWPQEHDMACRQFRVHMSGHPAASSSRFGNCNMR
jgi:hypothetical protein